METDPSPVRLWSAADSKGHSDGYRTAFPSELEETARPPTRAHTAPKPSLEHDAEALERPARARTAPVARHTEPKRDDMGDTEAGSDPRGHLGVTWGVYLCAGKPPLADIILSHPPELTRCDSVIGLAIPAMSGHIQSRGTASGDLYSRISGINRVFLS